MKEYDLLKNERIKLTKVYDASVAGHRYIPSDYIEGEDLWDTVQTLTTEQQQNIGLEIAEFLTELQPSKVQHTT